MTGSEYTDRLSDYLLPFTQSLGPGYISMHDNAPCHHEVRCVSVVGCRLTLWTSGHPKADLDPVEHVWDVLGTLLDDNQPKTEGIRVGVN